jgi:DNA-binding HxlR family transcriptional regulator
MSIVNDIVPVRAEPARVRVDQHPPEGFVRHSSLSDAINILADTWTCLIIREAFFGARRFEEFQKTLAIPRATLSKRLVQLEADKILARTATNAGGEHRPYRLTERGFELYPITLGMMRFGDKWLCEGTPPLALFHKTCRAWCSPRVVWQETGEAVDPRHIRVGISGDYWTPRADKAVRQRRATWDGSVRGRRPCSVERVLSIVGDRWTFLILQEFFHGNHRFDEFARNLMIGPNILTGRLNNLLRSGFVEKIANGNGYHLTEKGLDIYGPMILMKNWGERWLRNNQKNFDFLDAGDRSLTPVAVCSACGGLLAARQVSYVCNY